MPQNPAGSQVPTKVANNQAPGGPKKQAPGVPPDECFWKRYSAHHEFPLSSVSSVVAHCIMGLALVLIGYVVLHRHEDPLPMDTIALSDGGGGGNPEGEGSGPGNGVPPPPSKEVA